MKAADRFKIMGKELLQGNLGNAAKSMYLPESQLINSMSYRGLTGSGGQYGDGGFWMFGEGGHDMHFSFSSLKDSLVAYYRCPPVSAVINRKTQAHLNGKTWIMNTQGKAKEKEATGPTATKIKKLLTSPNRIQTWTQFEAQMKSFIMLFGYCPILQIKPVGMDATEATALWILPPWCLDIVEEDSPYITAKGNLVKSIVFNYRGYQKSLPVDDVFLVKDLQLSFSSVVIPGSRIQPLQDPINNIIGAYNSRNILINRRGAMGILSNMGRDSVGTLPMDAGEKEAVQSELTRYGLRSGQWQVIVTSASLQWQQMGYATKELMLFEEVEHSTMAICDGLGYQYRLLNENASNSLGGSDVDSFKKLLYTDFIIPEALNIYEQLNIMFNTAAYNLTIEKDFAHVPALQDDSVKAATARFQRNRGALIEFQCNLITLDQWRVMNGDDPVNDDFGGLYYYQLLQKGVVFGFSTGSSNTSGNVDPNADPNNNGSQNQNN